MSMVVRTNSMAMNANSALNKNNSTVAGNLSKLSTGFRINRAADDASGLAVSEKMKAQIKALDQAGKNAQDGASLIKTAEGYMSEIHDMLNRVVELAEKSANGTYETKDGETYGAGKAATDRQAIQDEVDQLTTEIDRIAKTANFNNLKLLDGSLDSTPKTVTTVTYEEVTSGITPSVVGDDVGSYYTRTGNATDGYTYTQASGKAQSETTYYELKELNTVPDDGYDTNDYRDADGNKLTAKPTTDGAKVYQFETKTGLTPQSNGTDVSDYYLDEAGTQRASGYAQANTTYYEKKTTTEEGVVTGSALKLQIGETSGDADKLEVSIMSFKTSDLLSALKDTTVDGSTEKIVVTNESDAAKTAGIDGLTFNVSNQDAASKVAEEVRKVINSVSSQRATLGAMENRLDYTMNNLDTASQNITDANSRIRDTDMAKTMMEYTQGNTLTQAAQAMLAQANQAPSQVLQLLQ